MDKTRLNCLTAKANAAFEQAATKIVERAKQTGTPVVVWEDDHVAEISPERVETVQRKTDTTN